MCKAIVWEDRQKCTYGMREVRELPVSREMLPIVKRAPLFEDAKPSKASRSWKGHRTVQYHQS